MARSIKKGPFVDESLMKKVHSLQERYQLSFPVPVIFIAIVLEQD